MHDYMLGISMLSPTMHARKVAAQLTWLEVGQIREVTMHIETKVKAKKGK